MKALLVVVLGAVLAYVLVDLAAERFVQARVEDELSGSERVDADDADFTIDSFPFLLPLAATGRVSATLTLEGVREQGLTIDEFRLDVDGLELDRTSAFNGRVRLNDLDRATASVTLSEASLGELAGTPVAIGTDGRVTANGVTVQATVVDGGIQLSGDGVGPVTVDLPLDRYLPCDPGLVTGGGEAVLSCETDVLPPIVNRALGQVRVGG